MVTTSSPRQMSSSNRQLASTRPLVFGEVLFDHFPDGSTVLGGAPFNIAWHLQGLGLQPLFISCIGSDPEGDEVLSAMQNWDMDTYGVQTDTHHPTGSVRVSLEAGQPSYAILPDRAYDFIESSAASQAAKMGTVTNGLLYHGTLAMRNDRSRAALQALLANSSLPVFVDINLRDPWWQALNFVDILNRARWLKVNDDELGIITETLGLPAGDTDNMARQIQSEHDIHLVVVTQGAQGALAFTDDGERATIKPDSETPVVDTVGAGDAFTAVTLLGLLSEWPLALTLQCAQAFASKICGMRGATTQDPTFYTTQVQGCEASRDKQ